jgi:metalloendopeptidase OMA1, mitochondrial
MNEYEYQQNQPRRKRRLILWPLVIAGVVAAFQYFSSQKYVNPETGRAAHVALSEGQEAALGLQSYEDVLSQSQVISSGPQVAMVKKVMNRLEAATGSAGKNMDWQVSVVDSPQANAFCLPGGKMVHATSRHGSQRLLQSRVSNTLLTGANASLALGDMDMRQKMEVMAALGAGAKYGVLLPFSRNHESEADEIGLYYMARAGYDPHEAVNFWQRMEQNSNSPQPPEFLSTHPSHGTRIQELNEHMPRADEEYRKAKSSGPA